MSGVIKTQGSAGESGRVTEDIDAPIFIGMIQPFAMSSPPSGWQVCNGAALSRTEYIWLFNVIGTAWGAGDGSSTFNIPRLQAAFLRGAGTHGTSQMGNTNAYAGGNIGTLSNDVQQEKKLHAQLNLIKIGGPQYLSGAVGRTIGVHGHAFRTGYFHYDHTQGGNSPYSGQFNHHGGITQAGGTTATDGGSYRATGETKPFNATVEYMIFSGVKG